MEVLDVTTYQQIGSSGWSHMAV